MAKTTHHIHISIRGMLKNATRRELAKLLVDTDTGRNLTADEAKDALMDHLAAGHEVMPCGAACEGFDYSGGGCPGHEATAQQAKEPRHD